MVIKPMEVDRRMQRLSLSTPPGVDFDALSIFVSHMDYDSEETAFHERIEKIVKAACGNTACSGCIEFETMTTNGALCRDITVATIECDAERCPLAEDPTD